MAKLSFNKLGLKVNQEVNKFNYNDQIIEVKQYLSINDKLMLISRVINASHDGNNFSNPVRVSVFSALEIVDAYTNISFTEKQKEDPVKLYDLLQSNGVLDLIFKAIPENEFIELKNGITQSIDAVYAYNNSVLGILESVKSDYSDMDLDITEMSKQLSDENNLSFLRDVLNKMD